MGRGNSKVMPEEAKTGYASVVRSLVAFTRARGVKDEAEKKRKSFWFGGNGEKRQGKERRPSKSQDIGDKGQRVKAKTYKDKFDPRVTARYDIKALIGRGSFSRVVRAAHRGTRRPYAIKMMEVEFPEGREVCAAELTALRRVSHPNVVRMVEVFQFPHRVYMVLELATGGALLDRVVSKGRFMERDAAKAIKMVLAAISYLHGLGITHRDLKPENLLYYHPGANSKLLVTDFGLATLRDVESERLVGSDGASVDTSRSLRSACGTPEFMAPEVVQRRPFSSAVDLWALGVIAFVVLSGSAPFEDESRAKLSRAIVRGKYSFSGDPWPRVSDPAKDFIARLLLVDPRARLTADQALQHPWVASGAPASSSAAAAADLYRPISRNLRRRASRDSSRGPSRSSGSGPGRRVSSMATGLM
ncbi:serine/threonine-protein kinase H1-like [Eucyclogobius newberryi]|uniref:serine/threonine-protein kinase H1-like n=1 Tax=Eucyclogobius newberryi TaxID=166745 RepID=UPI003B5CE1BD